MFGKESLKCSYFKPLLNLQLPCFLSSGFLKRKRSSASRIGSSPPCVKSSMPKEPPRLTEAVTPVIVKTALKRARKKTPLHLHRCTFTLNCIVFSAKFTYRHKKASALPFFGFEADAFLLLNVQNSLATVIPCGYNANRQYFTLYRTVGLNTYPRIVLGIPLIRAVSNLLEKHI